MTSPGPVAFSIFGIDIMWYGILIAAGMFIAVSISYKRAPRHGIKADNILDIVIFSIPMGIIGARLYYVIFEGNYDLSNFMEVINIRNGGLAIHGGLILGVLTAFLVCRYKDINALNVFDVLIPSVALAQSIGRWGNFFNNEAHGGPTNLPWGIVINGVKVHPTFLYESIWCLLLFILLSYYLERKHRFYGQIICMYGVLYSIERILVEQLRTDSLMLGPFKQAQLISIVIIIISLSLYRYFKIKYSLENSKNN